MTHPIPYDDRNVFARILRNEIPARKVFEDDRILAFHDIAPRAPVHVLVIPKGPHRTLSDFAAAAPAEEVAGFFRRVALIAAELGLEAPGYRILANHGSDAGQEVPHFHVHVLGGRALGPMLSPG